MSEIVAGVTVMQRFCSPGSSQFKNYVNYLDRDEAVRNDQIERYNLYNDYMGNPNKTTGLFSNEKNHLSFEEKKVMKEIFEAAQDNGSIMWQTVISFDNRWLEENHMYDGTARILDEQRLKLVAKTGINRMLKQEHLENAIWSAAIHYNTDNIHIHVAVVEPVPMRQTIMWKGQAEGKGKFKLDSIQTCKSSVVKEIINSKEINRMINQIIRKDIVEMKKERALANDPNIRKQFLKLYETLPNVPKNMMNYNNSVMKPCQSLVDEISRYYIDKYHKEDYQRLTEILTKQTVLYKKAYGHTQRDYQKEKEKDLMIRLGNAILKEVRNYDASMTSHMEVNNQPKEALEILEEDPQVILEADIENVELRNELEEMEHYFQEQNLQKKADEQIDVKSDINKKYKSWFKENKEYKNKTHLENGKPIDPEKAFQICQEMSTTGNPIIINTLASMYERGIGTEINIEKASRCYRSSFNQFMHDIGNCKEADRDSKFDLKDYLTYRIGKSYNYGQGVETDYTEAAKWFGQADNIYARFQLGNLYYSGKGVEKDYQKAFEYYHNAQSFPYASYKLGSMCENGMGTEKTPELAQQYYQRAFQGFMKMEQKEPDDNLEYRIGMMLLDGKGCNADREEAKKFLQYSADNKNVSAQYKLAMLQIEEGNQDEIKTAMNTLKELAEKPDHQLAQYALGKIFTDQTNPDYDLAQGMKYYEMAARQDQEYAQYQLGKLYLNPEFEIYDPERAVYYLKCAASQKNEYAQYQLGKLYSDINGAVYDIYQGEAYLKQAMSQGNEYAMFQLGKLYLDESCSLHNGTLGIQYMSELGDAGNEYAQLKMGFEYIRGVNVQRNIELSREWFTKAADQGNEQAEEILANLTEQRAGGGKRNFTFFDKALVQLKKSLNEEYRNSMGNIREYERDLRIAEYQEDMTL